MRIITGTARGLKLKTPNGLSTRPTADRVKESLFNILNGLTNFAEINAVLDIFAGTGALGLESMSRGAKSATFIDAATTQIIGENVRRTKFTNCTILRGDFDKILRHLGEQNFTFDLIFSDPPYATNFAQKSLTLVAELNLLNVNGLIIVEHGATETLNTPPNLQLVRQTIYGRTTSLEIFERTASP
ncbi:MAG: 16S rRNA (guanine(966)-N(2))-methyltransferase RsmD [Selenomonadaceae bacterium]|nr:16S rRNA (guanine(966)-N(2))-methyltransferase RsmD [Selenomonadaceae bacterium]